MIYEADFVTADERIACLTSGRPFTRRSIEKYLRVEPIIDHGIVLKARLSFRHSSLYSLTMGDWTYLNDNDLRNISPIVDFREHNKPFYITFSKSFYRVTDIRVNEDRTLIFFMEQVDGFSLN